MDFLGLFRGGTRENNNNNNANNNIRTNNGNGRNRSAAGQSPLLAAHAQVQNNARELAYTHWRVIFFWVTLVFNLVQLAATLLVLVLSRGQKCDRPLQAFLGIYALATLLHLVVMLWHYSEWDAEEAAYAFELESTNLEDKWVLAALTEFSNVFTLMTYVLGNVWVFGCKSCQFTAPALYILSLIWVIYGYLMLMLPILLLTLLIFCLPLFIFLMRMLYPPERRGASDQLISALPVYPYASGEALGNHPAIDKEDAECAICLGHYEEGEALRIFICKHHFHRECVDRWLGISATCPLCVRPVFPRTTTAVHSARTEVSQVLASMQGDDTIPLL